jgi:hypothetical protein
MTAITALKSSPAPGFIATVSTRPWISSGSRAGDAPVYLSFDIDGLDPAFAPGTGTPVAGGLASWQGLEFIRGLEPLNLIGMDLVEVAPAYDHAEITAIAAASMAFDWCAVIAKKRGARARRWPDLDVVRQSFKPVTEA